MVSLCSSCWGSVFGVPKIRMIFKLFLFMETPDLFSWGPSRTRVFESSHVHLQCNLEPQPRAVNPKPSTPSCKQLDTLALNRSIWEASVNLRAHATAVEA